MSYITPKLIGSSLCMAVIGFSAHAAPAPNETPQSLGCPVDFSASEKAAWEPTEMSAMISSFRTLAISVPVQWHVIRSTTGTTNGDISDTTIQTQMKILNAAYAACSLQFVLKTVDRTTNAAWYTMSPGSTAEIEAKKTLGSSTTSTLNLYTANPPDGLIGWSTMPQSLTSNPGNDGVVINFNALPGGTLSPYNEGDVMVHEVGHWLGLYHVSSGSCLPPGDYVSDTPPAKEQTYGCPSSKNTCPGGGPDPIHNFMDLSTDVCMDNFTMGQCTRIQSQVQTYRPALVTP